MTDLADALAAEHAAIFAYGVIGAHLEEARSAAREAERAHRTRRDELVLLLGDQAPAAEPSYELPFPVDGPDDAVRLAILVEERVAAIWRGVLPESGAGERERALDALTDAAVRATRWRATAGVDPAAVPFPGSPV
jgi:uncharacterized protein DUF4439